MSSVDIPKEAREKYLERRKVDLENCKKALEDRNFEVLTRIGHQVKGNAVTFGYDDLGQIAIELETFALSKDTQNLAEVLARFSKFLSTI